MMERRVGHPLRDGDQRLERTHGARGDGVIGAGDDDLAARVLVLPPARTRPAGSTQVSAAAAMIQKTRRISGWGSLSRGALMRARPAHSVPATLGDRLQPGTGHPVVHRAVSGPQAAVWASRAASASEAPEAVADPS